MLGELLTVIPNLMFDKMWQSAMHSYRNNKKIAYPLKLSAIGGGLSLVVLHFKWIRKRLQSFVMTEEETTDHILALKLA